MAFTRAVFLPVTREARPGRSAWLHSTQILALTACLLVSNLPAQEVETPVETNKEAEMTGPVFTSEILPVLYVKDVLRSVEFYRDSLGFDLHSYYDYELGKEVKKWTKDTPAIYAGMGAGDQKFALHRPGDPDTLAVGGARYYFGVEDVRAHRQRLIERGVDVSEIFVRPWMTMFAVEDPEGRLIFFFTRPES
jgi:catechol 2,3-dioxygenase-like lactoylglutathione lyase family enzyme